MPEGITGQVIYELFPDCAYTWDRLPLSEQQIYSTMAEKLNTQYLAPLQGLVRDLEQTFIADSNIRGEKIERLQRENDALKAVLTSYRVFVREAPIVSRYVDSAKWRGERADLLRIVDSLLKDEQKEK